MPQSQARLASSQYTFAPANKQITFSGLPGFSLDGLVEIFHVPSGKVIYDGYDDTGTLGATVSGNTITLTYDTTALTATDALRIIYNDLTREDLLVSFSPTTTGVIPGSVLPIKSYLSATAEVNSATNISVYVEVSIDGVNWKTGGQGLVGRLPNLYGNGGDTNLNQGAPYNTRQYDISAFRWIRLNVSSISAGSPVVNLLMKTNMAPIRDVFVTAGTVTSNFDSGASVGYVRTTSLYTEMFRGTLTASQVVTGGSRQAFGQPNPYYSRFGVTVVSDQSGSVSIQASTDSTNWITVATQAVTGGVPLDVEVKVRAAFYRAVYTNGATATSANAFSLLVAFCGA